MNAMMVLIRKFHCTCVCMYVVMYAHAYILYVCTYTYIVYGIIILLCTYVYCVHMYVCLYVPTGFIVYSWVGVQYL